MDIFYTYYSFSKCLSMCHFWPCLCVSVCKGTIDHCPLRLKFSHFKYKYNFPKVYICEKALSAVHMQQNVMENVSYKAKQWHSDNIDPGKAQSQCNSGDRARANEHMCVYKCIQFKYAFLQLSHAFNASEMATLQWPLHRQC